jgi:nucleoside-diphosphate-sugar epimerase
LPGQVRFGDVTDPISLAREGFRGEQFDAVVSCLASRTGVPADAWEIDHRAQLNVLAAVWEAGVRHFVLPGWHAIVSRTFPSTALAFLCSAFDESVLASRRVLTVDMCCRTAIAEHQCALRDACCAR